MHSIRKIIKQPARKVAKLNMTPIEK